MSKTKKKTTKKLDKERLAKGTTDKVFVVNEGICTETFDRFLRYVGKKKKIEILINTHGGDFHAAIAIYDYIKTNKIKAKVTGIGIVASAGMVILAAGAERYAYPNSMFMVHEGSLVNEDGPIGWYKAREFKRSMEISNEIYQSLFPKLKVTKKSKYFTAKEAFVYGVVDKII